MMVIPVQIPPRTPIICSSPWFFCLPYYKEGVCHFVCRLWRAGFTSTSKNSINYVQHNIIDMLKISLLLLVFFNSTFSIPPEILHQRTLCNPPNYFFLPCNFEGLTVCKGIRIVKASILEAQSLATCMLFMILVPTLGIPDLPRTTK